MADHPHTPRLLDAIDAFEDGIYIISDDYVVEYMNQYMKKLFGDGLGKKCHKTLVGRDEPCEWCNLDKVFAGGKPRHSQIYIPTVDKNFALSEMLVTNQDGTRSKLNICRDITHEIHQEQRLKSSRASYQRLFTHVGCGVFVSSREGRFLDVNPALLKMLGYQNKDEFLSLDLARDLYRHPEDRLRYTRILEKNGQVIDYEVQWRRRDGNILHLLVTSNVRYNAAGEILGYEGIVVDQTRRKRQENEIREAHDFLDKIIDCSPNAIMALDMKGTVRLWNQRAEELFDVKAVQAVGKMNIKEIFPEAGSKQVMEMMRSEKYGGVGKLNSYPMNFEDENGKLVEGNLSASIVYDESGIEIASVGLFADLRERLRTERELSEARQHLLQSEKLAAMGRLTSQIAHELNNPLFGIMNTLELMKTEIGPENKRRRLLDMSLSEIERLAEMLKKMLSFSKPDQDERREIDVHVIIDELMLLYEKRFRESGIKAMLDLDDQPAMVLASKDQLRQVFINLFSNSMYAMPNGGDLNITTKIFREWLTITVRDTGSGIKPKYIEKIFDSFFTTKTDSVKGVGLGLSVCYGFIQDHGGDIKVESEENKWTCFTISLPIISSK